MNWERGLLRLWLLISVLWIIGAGAIVYDELVESLRTWFELGVFLPEPSPGDGTGEGGSIDYLQRTATFYRIGALAALLFGPPAGALLLGVAIGWIFGGRDADNPSEPAPRLPWNGPDRSERRAITARMGERSNGGDL